MRSNLRLLITFLALLSVFSCKKGGDSAHDAEMRKFNAWIQVNSDMITDTTLGQHRIVTPTASGMYFVPLVAVNDTCKSPVSMDYVYYNYTIQALDGTVVGSTLSSVADDWGFKSASTHYTPSLVRLDPKYSGALAGILEALPKMKEGSKVRLILPSTLVYGSRGSSGIAGNTSVIITLEVVKVVTDIDAYEKSQVAKFAADSSFDMKIIDKDIFYKKIIDESEMAIKNNDTAKVVYVWYVGRYMDGHIFDTNIKDTAINAGIYNADNSYSLLSVAIGKKAVVPAFEDVLLEMWIGEQYKLVTTSEFCYGPLGNGSNIAAHTPLVFEITVNTYKKE